MMPNNLPPGPPGGFPSPGMKLPPQVVMDKTISQDHTQNQDHVFANALKALRRAPAHGMPPPPIRRPGGSSRSSSRGSRSDKEDGESAPIHPLRLADQLFDELQNKINNHPELLSGDGQASSRVIDSLISTIAKLQIENDVLKEELEAAKSTALGSVGATIVEVNGQVGELDDVKRPVIEHLYCVDYSGDEDYTYYKDTPFLFKGDRKKAQPRGKIPMSGLSAHLENNPNIAFLTIDVFRVGKSGVQDIFDRIGHSGGLLNKDYSLADDPKQTKTLDILLGIPAEEVLASIIENNKELFPGFEDSKDETHSPPYTLFFIHNKLSRNY